MPPGVVLVLPSLLVSVSPGVLLTGVLSLALALTEPLPMLALFTTCVMPAGTGLSTVTAKMALLDAPAARLPIANVQLVPAQLQPGALVAALNVVLAGTVSCKTTPVRP